jgi:hypothetical protein
MAPVSTAMMCSSWLRYRDSLPDCDGLITDTIRARPVVGP